MSSELLLERITSKLLENKDLPAHQAFTNQMKKTAKWLK